MSFLRAKSRELRRTVPLEAPIKLFFPLRIFEAVFSWSPWRPFSAQFALRISTYNFESMSSSGEALTMLAVQQAKSSMPKIADATKEKIYGYVHSVSGPGMLFKSCP
jgi:hypothetical protein